MSRRIHRLCRGIQRVRRTSHTGQLFSSGQRVVSAVVGLHRQHMADVLA